jgi:hypothetical protein
MLTLKQWLKLPEFQRPANKLPINIGQYLEIAGAAMCVTGVYLIAGLGVALIVGAVALVVAAEFVYSDPVMIKHPRTPHPIQRAKKLMHRAR